MKGRRVVVLAAVLGVLGARAVPAAEGDPAVEVRVWSAGTASTVITLRAEGEAKVVDRTPGARPAAADQGPLSVGDAFTDEIRLEYPGMVVGHPTALDVGDPFVSIVRVVPEGDHTAVVIFVRQPVSYVVSRPSALGETTVELKPRTVTVAGPGGAPHRKAPHRAPADEREVALDADTLTYEQETNSVIATGAVTITRGDMVLRADEVRYDRTNGIADAKGHVVMTDPGGTMEGDVAHVNMRDETGWVDHTRAELLPTGYRLVADRGEKTAEQRYCFTNSSFTTCRCSALEKPPWSLAGQRTDVEIEGLGVLHQGTFRVKDIPVLWLPWLPFPANQDRQSGFLFPRISHSSRRGWQYEQPFYWAIDKSSDATFALDVETAARIGLIGEYRYARSLDTYGNFTAAYFNEAIRDTKSGFQPTNPDGEPVDVGENRFMFGGRHTQVLAPGRRFYLDMLAVSDSAFLREMNTLSFGGAYERGIRTLRYTTNRAGLLQNWNGGFLQGEFSYRQDLVGAQELVPQKLPRITGEHSEALLGDKLVARFGGDVTDYQRESAYDGLRADLAPDLYLPFRLGRYINGSIRGAVRESVYKLTNDDQYALIVPLRGCAFVQVPNTTNFVLKQGEVPGVNCSLGPFANCADVRKNGQKAVPGINCLNADATGQRHFSVADTPFLSSQFPALGDTRSQPSGDVRVRIGTELARVYSLGSWGKVRHTIEPEVGYFFVPDIARPYMQTQFRPCRRNANNVVLPGEIPGQNCDAAAFSEGFLFDERDAVNQRNLATWGITNRLLVRDWTAGESTDVTDEAHPEGAPAPRELARLSLLHGYDFSRQLVGTSHATDVDVGLRIAPLTWLNMGYDTTVSFQDLQLRGQTARAGIIEPNYVPVSDRKLQRPSSLSVAYSFVKAGVTSELISDPVQKLLFEPGGQNAIQAGGYLRLGQYAGIFASMVYDLNDTSSTPGGLTPHFIQRSYFLHLISRCDCWVVDVGVTERTNHTPLDEQIVRVQFTLYGLGSFGRGPANYVGMPGGYNYNRPRPAALGGGFF